MDSLVWACTPIPATPCELCKSVHAYGTLGLQLDNGNLLSFEYAFSSLTLTCSYSLVYLTRWWSGYGLLMWVFWGMCSSFLPIVLKVYTNVMVDCAVADTWSESSQVWFCVWEWLTAKSSICWICCGEMSGTPSLSCAFCCCWLLLAIEIAERY